jgi:NADPH:quinone reductase-like Zn-dependent oxidoreductase
LRELGENDVLVKVHSAAINPSDVAFTKGYYPAKKNFPTIGGFEGSGVVVQTGSSSHASALKDKKVAFISSNPEDFGSWGEYTVLNSHKAYPVPEGVSLEEAACALVNPLTVEGFIVTCQEQGHKAIVHSAAASSLGKMLVKACKKNNIVLINIVRRPEQVETLEKLGAEHILNSSDAAFETDLAYRISQYHPTAFFDAVGGQLGTTVFTHLPVGSTAYLYGVLSGDRAYNVPAGDLIFKKKMLRGWWLTAELEEPQRALKIMMGSFANLASGDYKSEISKSFPHEKYQEALEFYSKNASEGKVVLHNPSFNN